MGVFSDKEELCSHPYVDLDLEIFWRIFQHYKIKHFPQFGSYLWKNDRIFMKAIL